MDIIKIDLNDKVTDELSQQFSINGDGIQEQKTLYMKHENKIQEEDQKPKIDDEDSDDTGKWNLR